MQNSRTTVNPTPPNTENIILDNNLGIQKKCDKNL
jgi:hypothetical protein